MFETIYLMVGVSTDRLKYKQFNIQFYIFVSNGPDKAPAKVWLPNIER